MSHSPQKLSSQRVPNMNLKSSVHKIHACRRQHHARTDFTHYWVSFVVMPVPDNTVTSPQCMVDFICGMQQVLMVYYGLQIIKGHDLATVCLGISHAVRMIVS